MKRIRKFISREVPPSRCSCGALLDMATPAPILGTPPDAEPSRDPSTVTSISVCFQCGRAWQFDKDLRLKSIDVNELPDEARRAIRHLQGSIIVFRGVKS